MSLGQVVARDLGAGERGERRGHGRRGYKGRARRRGAPGGVHHAMGGRHWGRGGAECIRGGVRGQRSVAKAEWMGRGRVGRELQELLGVVGREE